MIADSDLAARTSPSGFVRGLLPVLSASSASACHIGFSLAISSWYESRDWLCLCFKQWTLASVPCNSMICVDGGGADWPSEDVRRDRALGCKLSTCHKRPARPLVQVGRVRTFCVISVGARPSSCSAAT